MSFRLETQLQELHLVSEQGQAIISHKLTSHGDALNKVFTTIMETQQKHDQRLDKLESTTSPNSMNIPLSKQPNSSSTAQALSPPQYSDSPDSFSEASFSALRLRFLRRRKCDVRCRCRCHVQTRGQSPKMLQSVLGTLFVGYAGLPVLTASCNSRLCQRSSEGFLQVNYYFPQWFLARILSLVVRFQDAQTPEISLRLLNVRSSYESIFQYAHRGDADSIKFLLTKGKASVLDVTDDSGHSPLHVCDMQRICYIEANLGCSSRFHKVMSR